MADERASTRRAAPDARDDRDRTTTGYPADDRPVDEPRDDRRIDEPGDRRVSKQGARDLHKRQAAEFGGFSKGAALFGWLVAVGIAALLTALLSAAGAAVGLTDLGDDATGEADAVGIVGGVLLLLVLLLAYYGGGYVAGRMARFNGPRQGVGVWIFGLVATIILAVLGVVLGAEYNVFGQLNLPRIPIDEGSLTTGGVIVLAAVLVGTLLAAVAGGKMGTRFHRRIDRAGLADEV